MHFWAAPFHIQQYSDQARRSTLLETTIQTPAAMSVVEFARWAGIGRTTAFNEIRFGRLKAVKVNRRTLVTSAEAVRWLNALPARQSSCEKGC